MAWLKTSFACFLILELKINVQTNLDWITIAPNCTRRDRIEAQTYGQCRSDSLPINAEQQDQTRRTDQ